MLGHQALTSTSVVHCPKAAHKFGRVSSPRLVANAHQASRCRSNAPASKPKLGKLSQSSVTIGSNAPKRPIRIAGRRLVPHASNSVQASYASPAPDAKSSLTPVLIAVAFASLGALLFGLHVAIVNGLQDAVSAELGFSANTGLRGAVSLKLVQLSQLSCKSLSSTLLAFADGVHCAGWCYNWQYFRQRLGRWLGQAQVLLTVCDPFGDWQHPLRNSWLCQCPSGWTLSVWHGHWPHLCSHTSLHF